MAAGQGFKTFTTGEVLTATDVNGYLMQGVLVFASAAARNAAITSPQEGQFAFTKDVNGLWYYDGAAWVASGATGDIEGVTAGTGISGGGTSGTVTVSIDTAVTVDKTTAQTLTNKTLTTPIISSISNTGTLTLPTSTDTLVGRATTDTLTNKTLTSPALTTPTISTLTTNGDLVYGTGSGALSRLGIGSTSQVLTVTGGVPVWETPAAGGGITLISTVVPSASSGFSFSSISASYKHLLLTWSGILHSNNSTAFDVRLNANSGANYNSMVYYGANTSLAQANAGGASSYNPTVPVFGKNVANAGFNNTNSGYLWLYDYANTSYAKQCSGAWVFYDSSGAAHTQIWNSQMTFDILTAISSIDITRISGSGTMTITTNGSVKLWGMA